MKRIAIIGGGIAGVAAAYELARMAREGGAVVSNDREVRRAAERAGAIVVTTDQFLARLDQRAASTEGPAPGEPDAAKDVEDEPVRGPRKGNPRRLSKKDRATKRALGRLGHGRHPHSQ